MLDTGRVNGQTIYALNIGIDPRKCKSFEFGIGLARGLVLPLIESRPLTGLKIFIQRKMSFMLKKPIGKIPGGETGSLATAAGVSGAAIAGAASNLQGAVVAAKDAVKSMTKYPMSLEVESRCQLCKIACQGADHKAKKDFLICSGFFYFTQKG